MFAEVFATEDVKIGISGLITEVPGDVAGLDQLDQGQACLVASSEVLDHRFPIGLHVNLFYHVESEIMNSDRAGDKLPITIPSIYEQMTTPHTPISWAEIELGEYSPTSHRFLWFFS